MKQGLALCCEAKLRQSRPHPATLGFSRRLSSLALQPPPLQGKDSTTLHQKANGFADTRNLSKAISISSTA